MLVDSHAHIYMRHFDADRDEVVQRTIQGGIEALLCVGIDIRCSRASIELANKYSGIFATVGIHPHDAVALDAKALSDLADLARQPKVVGIGEIGLDFYRNISPRDVQIEALLRQLDLAAMVDLPVVIHNRDADKEIMTILRKWIGAKPATSRKFQGVIHCFSGDLAMANECTKLGFLVSVAGNITYPNATRLADVIRDLPLEYLLVETDCPFLTPHPRRSQRNEPADVKIVAEKVAEIKSVDIGEVAEVTTRNFAALFNLTSLQP